MEMSKRRRKAAFGCEIFSVLNRRHKPIRIAQYWGEARVRVRATDRFWGVDHEWTTTNRKISKLLLSNKNSGLGRVL